MPDVKSPQAAERQGANAADPPADKSPNASGAMTYEPDGDTFTTELDNLLDLLGKGLDVDSIKEELASSQAAEPEKPQTFKLLPLGGQIFGTTHADLAPSDLLKSLADQIDAKCPFDYLMLLRKVAQKPDYMRMDALIDRNRNTHPAHRVYPLKDSVLSEVNQQQRPAGFALTEPLRGKFEKELYDRWRLQSCLLIPLPDSGAGSGLLAIGSKTDSQYTDGGPDVEWLASGLSLALQRRQLAAAFEKQSAAVELIKQIGRGTVAEDFDFDRLLKYVLAKIRDIFELEAGLVYVKEGERLKSILTFNTGADGIKMIRQKIGQRLAGVVVARGKPIMVNDTQKFVKSSGELAKQKVLHTRAILCVPLTSQGKARGAMEVFSRENAEIEKLDDALLNAIAAALGPMFMRQATH